MYDQYLFSFLQIKHTGELKYNMLSPSDMTFVPPNQQQLTILVILLNC